MKTAEKKQIRIERRRKFHFFERKRKRREFEAQQMDRAINRPVPAVKVYRIRARNVRQFAAGTLDPARVEAYCETMGRATAYRLLSGSKKSVQELSSQILSMQIQPKEGEQDAK